MKSRYQEKKSSPTGTTTEWSLVILVKNFIEKRISLQPNSASDSKTVQLTKSFFSTVISMFLDKEKTFYRQQIVLFLFLFDTMKIDNEDFRWKDLDEFQRKHCAASNNLSSFFFDKTISFLQWKTINAKIKYENVFVPFTNLFVGHQRYCISLSHDHFIQLFQRKQMTKFYFFLMKSISTWQDIKLNRSFFFSSNERFS